MVLLDNDNKPVKYDTVDILMETFYHVRLGYYHKRKENIIKTIGENIVALNEKIRFILAVIKGYELIKIQPNITEEEALEQGALLVMGKGKKKLMVLMEKGGFSSDLLKVTLSQCTEDEVVSAKEKLASLEAERKITEETDPKIFWLSDLNKFTTRYCKYYKCEYISPSKMGEQPSDDEGSENGGENEENEKENEEDGDENEGENGVEDKDEE
jgi:DNA topoisomerase-2